MERKLLNSKFYRYVLPSMFTMLLSGFYSIVDGLFVGNSIGNAALAAINIAYPIQVILNASAIGLGIGGAVALSYFTGKNDEELAKKSLGSTFLLLVCVGVCLSFVLSLLAPTLLTMLGAKGSVYKHAYDYIFVILLGGILPVLGNGLNPLIRNVGKTIVATLCMSSGLITNIILDYVLVFKWNMGLTGAALATIIAQGVVAISALSFLYWTSLRHLNFKSFLPTWALLKRILHTGLSPFGQTLIPCIVIILTNLMCLKYGGDDAVTVFSVVSYVLASAQLLLQGIGDGIQPLLSFYHGRNEKEENHYLYQKAFFLALVCAFVMCVMVFVFSEPLSLLFNVSDAIMDETKNALIITSLAFPFIAISRLTSAVFYATGKAKNSTFLIYLEPCLLLPSLLILFSSVFELTGIWVAYPIAQVILSMLALILQSPNLVVKKEMHWIKHEKTNV